jgi:ethanolaminephosphotransferase
MVAGLGLLALASLALVRVVVPSLRAEDGAVRAFVLATTVIYLATFFATSFIEEEHEFWFFATATGLLLLGTK